MAGSSVRFQNKWRWGALMIFFAVLLISFFSISALTVSHIPKLSTMSEAEAFDFTENVGIINRNLFDFYPDQLYTPADFAAGRTVKPEYTPESKDNYRRQYYRYGTYRLTLDLPAGYVYAISSDSATYSQKVWVNGKLLSTVGNVSSSSEDFVPRTKHYTVCFTATDSPTEIIVQRANFVHWSGALFEIRLGPQTQVFQIVTEKLLRSVAALGLLFAAFLIFFGVALFFPDRRQFMWFALSSLSLCIRDLFVSPKPIMILFPELNWYFGHKLEHIAFVLAFLFMLMFYNAEFKDMVFKAVRYAGYVIFSAIGAVYLLLPSTIYSRMTQTTVYIMIAYGAVYVAFFIPAFFRRRREYDHQDSYILIVAGALIFILSSIADGVLYRRTGDYNISQIGMLMTVFITSIALTIESRRAQDELAVANAREENMRMINQTLSNLYKIRMEFMSDISHEMKTPLTVMSSYAGLTKMQIEKDAVNAQTMANLEMVQSEAVRLAGMVEKLKNASSDKNRKLVPSRDNICETLNSTAEFCRLICSRRNNTIEVKVSADPLYAEYTPDGIIQVLYNLIINSSRHCRDSVISLEAEAADGYVQVTVTDRGEGISPDILPRVFERGVSGDSSSGLGLTLCRDIIEEGGGQIWIVKTSSEGTSVRFTVPEEFTSYEK